MKKGQVTIFIILGIVILFIVAGMIFLLREPIKEVEGKVTGEINTNQINFFVENCITQITVKGMRELGTQGGYYRVPQEIAVKEFAFDIPRYKAEPNQEMISKEVVAQGLSLYVNEHLDECIQGFSAFDKELEIQEEGHKAKVQIVPQQIIVNLEYPLTISSRDNSKTISSFNVDVKTDLAGFLDEIQESFNEVKKEPEFMPVGALTQLAFTNDYQIENTNIDDDTVVFVYLFDPQLNDIKPFVFNYAVDYDWRGTFE